MSEAAEIQYWTARKVLAAFLSKEISPAEYAQVLLSHSQKHKSLNAFIHLDPRHVDEQSKRPSAGPLAGLPIAFKDAIGTSDMPTTAGTMGLKDHRPSQDAEVVAKLKANGAYGFGKLNMHELSYGITSHNANTGAVLNPYDPTRIPGGSSGGAGAAVAAGLVPVAIGTDTGGSIRIPAALCGVVGFRPTLGRYGQAGIVPVSSTRDTAGPLCRSVDDAALIDAAITAAHDVLDPILPSKITLGLPQNHFLEELDDDVRHVFEARIEDLRASGIRIKHVNVAEVCPVADSCGFPIALYETKMDLTAYLTAYAPNGPSFDELIALVKSPDVRGILEHLQNAEYVAGLKVAYEAALSDGRPKLQRALADCFAQNGIDALIFPTTRLTARPIGDDETVTFAGANAPTFPTYIHNTDPGSIAGIPGISLPAGLDRNGLPIGMELDGPQGSDRRLLAIASVVEKAMPPAERPKKT